MPRYNKGLQIWHRKDRECWEVGEYEFGKRKRRATNLRSREEAQARLAELLTEQQPAREPTTIGEAMAYYLEHHAPTIARPDHLMFFAEKLAPFWGNVGITEVNKALCQRYVQRRRDEFRKRQEGLQKRKKKGERRPIREMSNDSIRRELEQLQACLRFAYNEGLVTTVPPVWKPNKSPPRSRWLTQDEAAKLLATARSMKYSSEYLTLFILIALYTGARKEAVLSLKWPQVDLKRELIDFRPGQVSSNKGRSVVPIPKRLLRELVEAKKQGTGTGYVIHVKKTVVKKGVKTVVHERLLDIKKGFREACIKAKLEGVTPHTLRHTAASWMVQKGVPLFEVARYLGHTSTLMVERTYGHMAPEHLKRAKESWG